MRHEGSKGQRNYLCFGWTTALAALVVLLLAVEWTKTGYADILHIYMNRKPVHVKVFVGRSIDILCTVQE